MFTPSTIVEVARSHALSQGDALWLSWLADGREETSSFTFAELDRRARALAVELVRALPASSAAYGEWNYPAALILTDHGPDFVVGFFACLYAGIVAVPAYPPKKGESSDRLLTLLASAGAKLALASSSALASSTLSAELSAKVPLLCVNTVKEELADSWVMPKLNADSVAFIQYTSGSTGAPKGVVVTHGNLLANQRMIAQGMASGPDTIVLGWLPLFHDMGLIGNLLHSLYLGVRLILMAPTTFVVRPLLWLEAISRYRATISGGPNFAYDLCCARISPEQRKQLDLSSWQVAFNGAEPVRAASLRRFARSFAASGFNEAAFFPCYGMAEATLFVTGAAPLRAPTILQVNKSLLTAGRIVIEEQAEAAPRSALVGCGVPATDCEVQIVDPSSHELLPERAVGEIWIHGHNVAHSYMRQPELSEQTFRATLAKDPAKRRFLRSGDLGFLHGGELFVTGRIKDLIIVNGRNLYPQDIEQSALESHAALAGGTAAAFSIEGSDEEQVVLLLYLNAESPPLEAIARAVTSAVTQSQGAAIADLVLVGARLPVTSSNKIRRAACRQLYQRGELPRVLFSTKASRERVFAPVQEAVES